MMGEAQNTLVLVHGAGSAADIWDRVRAALTSDWRVLTPDLPGHGGAAHPGRQSVEAYAEWLEGWLAEQGVDSLVLAGHSMGGAIALQTALRGRVVPRGLILVSTGARLRVPAETLAGIRDDFERTMKRMGDYSFGPTAPFELRYESQPRLQAAGPMVVHDDFAACDAFDVLARLGEISLPTLVVCGADDQMTPPKYSQYLADHLPEARLELVEASGHMLPAEQPLALARAIGGFLASLDADR